MLLTHAEAGAVSRCLPYRSRELRDNPEALHLILVPTAAGAQVPLEKEHRVNFLAVGTRCPKREHFLGRLRHLRQTGGEGGSGVVKRGFHILEAANKEEVEPCPGIVL